MASQREEVVKFTPEQLAHAQKQIDVDAQFFPYMAGKVVGLRLPDVAHSIFVIYEDGREQEYIGKPAVDIQLAGKYAWSKR